MTDTCNIQISLITLNASSGSVELLDEFIKGAKLLVNGRGQSALGKRSTTLTLGSQVLPEESVVDVSTTVELEGVLKGELLSQVIGLESTLKLLLSGIESIDIGLVVLGVVKLHDFSVNVGFKSLIFLTWISHDS